MGYTKTSNPSQILEAIASGNETFVHYWPEEYDSPVEFMFQQEADGRGGVEFFVLQSDFVPQGHGGEEMPLTVLYKGGEEQRVADMNPNSIIHMIHSI